MEFKKEEILEMAKARGIDLADELAEKGMKELAHLLLDVIGKIVDASENKYDDMIKAAVEGRLREMADAIEVKF